MFIVKTSAMLKALKRYEASVTPEDVQDDMTLQVLYTRELFFTEKPARYSVYFTTDQDQDQDQDQYVVILTIGDDSYVYAFNDNKQVDYCLEASATEIDLNEEFYLIVSPLYDTIALYNNKGFCCDELTTEQAKQAIARLSKFHV